MSTLDTYTDRTDHDRAKATIARVWNGGGP